MRLLYNVLQATLDADITSGDTTVTFTSPLKEWGEDNIATIAAPDTLAMRVDNELVYVTAYTSGASTATILRAQEGSTATAHSEGAIFRHDATADDYGAGSAYTPGGTDVAVADGGTGASTAGAARTNLGLVIGTDVLGMGGGTLTGDLSVPDEVYDATAWNGSVEVPTKNAVRDKIETLGAGGAVATDTIWNAKGDLAGGTGSDTAARLAVGSNGQVLTADSAEATGMKWAAGGSGGGISPSQVTTQTTTYTAAAGDIVLASASGGAWVLTLPAVAAGRWVTVKKTDSSVNAITVTPASGTIDGASTLPIVTQYASRDLVSDGTNWFVL